MLTKCETAMTSWETKCLSEAKEGSFQEISLLFTDNNLCMFSLQYDKLPCNIFLFFFLITCISNAFLLNLCYKMYKPHTISSKKTK